MYLMNNYIFKFTDDQKSIDEKGNLKNTECNTLCPEDCPGYWEKDLQKIPPISIICMDKGVNGKNFVCGINLNVLVIMIFIKIK